jgi:valyl-tRNA synthetase
LLEKTEPYALAIGGCQRCKTVVEPLVSTQWFVKMKPLAEPAIQAVEDGRIQFIPDNWAKTYFEWMRNIRDWCISRQLWWGHRIPAWHCQDCKQVSVAREAPAKCGACGSSRLEQDPDVLDTWFSSGLWPFSTLGWPDETADLKKYYPTSVLITAYDIIFFWVARMIVMGLECTGEVPFRKVYIHGLVRDAHGHKMSKTRGNVIDPLAVTEKYGTDAVRMSLIMAAAPGMDVVAGEDRMEAARSFANKIWNAARFLFMNMERSGVEPWAPEPQTAYRPEAVNGAVPLEDRWIFSRLNRHARDVNRSIEQYRFHEAGQLMWEFVWHEFCDWYVEIKKLRFEEKSGLNGHWRNILTVFESALRLLHPAMPFLTEEVWQRLVVRKDGHPASIALAKYPRYDPAAEDAEAERQMELVQQIIVEARALRADAKLDPKTRFEAVVVAEGEMAALALGQVEAIEKLANVKLSVAVPGSVKAEGLHRQTKDFDILLKVSGSQLGAQRARLEKEIQQLEKVIAGSERQLSNEEFLKKAPPHVLDSLRAKLIDYQAQLVKSRATLEGLTQ